ncbi:hypothetical protein GO495_02905 [Chitinophaga oryziterrae]|uniref:PhnB-like domain-containing protein n=1 Tax=Chitinophaga oryziterrae TaxID=1031224 RepID=A0A6N8J3M1_9BACT|nr:hypothetical protein [Chitinophaga oryziterrae]MVT39524.1 hypothetical protein [Chitinophaga oryziterrae]
MHAQITPFLLFNTEAEKAAHFYVSCGWLKDKYDLTWQVAHQMLPRLMNDPNSQKASAVMKAMMKMKKIIIKDIQEAYDKA